MYQFAYPALADELLPHPPLSYSEKLSLALELLDFAGKTKGARHERLWALSGFRRLWMSIANDLAHSSGAPDGVAPPALLALSQAVMEEIDGRRMRDGKESGLHRKSLV